VDLTYTLPAAEFDARRSRALVAGGVGLAACAIGYVVDASQFFRAWLIAYELFLGITLGSMAMVMIQHLSGGAWGIFRRIFEASSRTMPLMVILFIPVLLGMHELYPWTHADLVAEDHILQSKSLYLNTPFFLARAAFYFAVPPARSPAWWAFRAYRNFDGQGGRFQDTYVPSRAEEGTSLFVSRSEDGKRMVAVALNVDPDTARSARVDLKGCGVLKNSRVLTYAGEASGFAEQPASGMSPGMMEAQLPPYSITVLDLTLEPPAKAPGKASGGKAPQPASP